MTQRWLPLALATLLATHACSEVARAPRPSLTGWLELDSPHFVLRTDLAYERAVETVQRLEHLLSTFVELGWNARGLPKLDVAVFSNGEEVHAFGPFNGVYLRSALLSPLAVAVHHDGPDALSSLKHELTHHIAFQVITKQPAWFAEGIAVYYSTAWVKGAHFELGRVPPEMPWYGLMPTAELLSPDADRTDARFYSTAWLLTHYLMSRRREDFVAYQRTLAQGQAFSTAWDMHFADLVPGRLDEILVGYLREGSLRTMHDRFSPEEVPVRVRALPDSELYAMRARLYFRERPGNDWLQRAQQNLELALQADPDSVSAALVRIAYAARDRTEQLTLARALTARNPDDWQAWLALASLEEEAAGAGEPIFESASIARLLALRPGHPRGTMFAARKALRAGHAAEALDLSERALRAAPTDALLVKMRVEILDRTQRRPQACVLLRDLVGAQEDAAERAVLQAQFARHCRPWATHAQ